MQATGGCAQQGCWRNSHILGAAEEFSVGHILAEHGKPRSQGPAQAFRRQVTSYILLHIGQFPSVTQHMCIRSD